MKGSERIPDELGFPKEWMGCKVLLFDMAADRLETFRGAPKPTHSDTFRELPRHVTSGHIPVMSLHTKVPCSPVDITMEAEICQRAVEDGL